MSKHKKSSLTVAVFFLFTLAPNPLTGESSLKMVLAQTETKTGDPPLKAGADVKIDGSDSLKIVNENLKAAYEKEYTGKKVTIKDNGTDTAIKELEAGKIDLAGIGRPLTESEKGKGLKEVVIRRDKIAIITGPSNPYKGDIPLAQFAKIFYGQIKNWSEVGGASGPIKLIDRPSTSDTRNAFKIYPDFKNGLKTGTNAVTVASDKTEDVVQKLGKDGIGYALIDQVRDRKDVHIVPMNKVLPSDPRYPFSQPLYYIYKGPNPNPAVKSYLCYSNTSTYATESDDHMIVTKEFCGEPVAAATPAPVVTPAATPAAVVAPAHAAKETSPPWWLLLLAPLLALPFLLGGKKEPEPVVVPPPVRRNSRIILTPHNCKDVYAYWEVPEERKQELREQGGQRLAIRLYDVTDEATPKTYETFEVNGNEQDLHIPVSRDDRDYRAEIGYWTEENRWLPIAKSDHVRVPACPPTDYVLATKPEDVEYVLATKPEDVEYVLATKPEDVEYVLANKGYVAAAGVAAAGAAAVSSLRQENPSRIVLVPYNDKSAYAYWEVPEAQKAALSTEGGTQLVLKIHDATDINLDQQSAHATQEYEVAETDQDQHVPIPVSNRDYVAEIGYKTLDNRWLPIAKSLHTHVSSETDNPLAQPLQAGSNVVAGGLNALQQTGENVAGQVSNLKDNIGGKASNIAGTVTDKASNIAGTVADKASNIAGTVTDKASNIAGTVTDKASNIAGTVGDKAGDIFGNIKEKGQDLFDEGEDFFGDLFDEGTEHGSNAVNKLKSTAETVGDKAGDIFDNVKEKGQDLFDGAGDLFSGLFHKGTEHGSDAVDKLKSTAETVGDKTGNIFDNVLHSASAAIAGGAVAATGLSATVSNWAKDKTKSLLPVERVVVVPHGDHQIQVNWQISPEEKAALKEHGGEKLVLRVHHVAELVEQTTNIYQEEISDQENQKIVTIPASDRNYIADIGYLTAKGEWLSLAKSALVHVPRI